MVLLNTERINAALEAIEDANKAKLENTFHNMELNSEVNLRCAVQPNKRLCSLHDGFADLRPLRYQL